MFVTRGNILSLLCSTNISYKEKESIIKKYDKLLKKALENANSSTLVEFLFNAKVPKSAKEPLLLKYTVNLKKYLNNTIVIKKVIYIKFIIPKY